VGEKVPRAFDLREILDGNAENCVRGPNVFILARFYWIGANSGTLCGKDMYHELRDKQCINYCSQKTWNFENTWEP